MSAVSVNTMTVRVPIAIRKRRGRKRVVAPDGTELTPLPEPSIDTTLVKALARAHRWRRMLEEGEYGTLRDLAAAERINASYVSRVLRLTLLSPNVVEAILDGRQPEGITLPALMRPISLCWRDPFARAQVG